MMFKTTGLFQREIRMRKSHLFTWRDTAELSHRSCRCSRRDGYPESHDSLEPPVQYSVRSCSSFSFDTRAELLGRIRWQVSTVRLGTACRGRNVAFFF